MTNINRTFTAYGCATVFTVAKEYTILDDTLKCVDGVDAENKITMDCRLSDCEFTDQMPAIPNQGD